MDAPQNDLPSISDSNPGWMDRSLPRIFRLFVLVAITLIPTCYIIGHYNPQQKFTSLILFGSEFQNRVLPEIKLLNPAVDSPYGYDGQFYAQLAIDPFLQRPDLRKMSDNAAFRAQRIFLPAMAFILGFGQPAIVIEVYAVLNLVFWFLLLAGLLYYLRATTTRHYLSILAIVLTTGSLTSLQRSLTDLPMATLGFYAMALSGLSATFLMALAILTKPTAGLFLLKYVWPFPKNGNEVKVKVFYVLIVLVAPILWNIYIYHIWGAFPDSKSNIGWPFKDWSHCVATNWQALITTPFRLTFQPVSYWEWRLFELLAPLSLMFQAVYLLIRRNPDCAYWWMGVGFALLFICLTQPVFAEQIASARTVLPMTIAFNIQLLQQKGSVYAFCFFGGNAGLVWALHETLVFCFR